MSQNLLLILLFKLLLFISVVGLERIAEIDLTQNQLTEVPLIKPGNTLKVHITVHVHVYFTYILLLYFFPSFIFLLLFSSPSLPLFLSLPSLFLQTLLLPFNNIKSLEEDRLIHLSSLTILSLRENKLTV